MTIEDKHFRTDGKEVEVCCDRVYGAIMDEYVYIDTDYEKLEVQYYDEQSDLLYVLKNCPFCGAKLEYVEKLEASQ